ncbi:ISAzo13-like element transposase-related protein [Streptomyces sp. BBFR102]|uniref:ISAzo13-like element transposase-related protein n=1 Tax=Streptomyces sp. BBFR102 TaxID=3448171 RepID=UPI003F52E24D
MTEATDGPLSRALLRLMPNLDERQRRLALGAVAEGLGRGGVRTVAKAARVAESTVSRGVRELDGPHLPAGRVRRAGAGRKPLTERDPGLMPALLALARSAGPEGAGRSPLEWTTLSVRELAQALTLLGHPVGPDTVSTLLKAEGFALQPSAYTSVRGTREHRIARLRHGAALLRGFTDAGHPAIRVRAEPAAEPGRRARGCGECVQEGGVPQLRSAACTDLCVRRRKAGARPVVGRPALPFDDAGTAALIASAVRHWWVQEGGGLRPRPERLLVAVEAGSQATSPDTLRRALAEFAAACGTEVTACHLPPATLRWPTAEHRLSCRVTASWDGLPAAGEHVLIGTVGPLHGQSFPARPRALAGLPVPRGAEQWNYTLRPGPATP